MVSVNTVLQVDVLGQAARHSIGPRHFSGTGGQLDTLSRRSVLRGGLGLHRPALDGQRRHHLHHRAHPGDRRRSHGAQPDHTIVTEYGIAELRGRSVNRLLAGVGRYCTPGLPHLVGGRDRAPGHCAPAVGAGLHAAWMKTGFAVLSTWKLAINPPRTTDQKSISPKESAQATHLKPFSHGVAIVGVGISSSAHSPRVQPRELFVEAFRELRASVDKGFDHGAIEALYLGNYSSDLFEGQGHMAPIMADAVGLCPVPATCLEDACASGGVALRQVLWPWPRACTMSFWSVAWNALPGCPLPRSPRLRSAVDTLDEIPAGFTFPGFYGGHRPPGRTRRAQQTSMTPEHLMNVAIKNHENGALIRKLSSVSPSPIGSRAASPRAIKKGKPATWRDQWDFFHDDAATRRSPGPCGCSTAGLSPMARLARRW